MGSRCFAVAAALVIGACAACSSGSETSAPSSAPATGDTSTTAEQPAEGSALNGMFRKFQELSKTTTNGVPTPGADENYWWAFRSACLPAGCVATATALDDNDHSIAAAPPLTEVYRFAYGGWESVSELDVPCSGDPAAVEKLRKVVKYVPQADGSLKGENTQTIIDNGCGREGNVFAFPTTLIREGDAPTGVPIADPATVG